MSKKEKFIDLKEVIRKKDKRLAALMPGFVLNYLRRIVHEDDVNDFINRHGHKKGLDFVYAIMDEFGANLKVIAENKIPPTGRYIMASNHPLGGIDGIAFMSAVSRVRSDFIFPVNDILLSLDNLKDYFIPINKHGSNAENIRMFNDTFASEKLILYFPAGLVSRKKKGEIIDLEWKKTIVTKARQHKRDVIPVYMDGKNSNFFYNLANLRTRLGVKANLEMLYLVNETYKQYNKTIHIVIGDAIPWESFDRSRSDLEWAAMVREKVYELKEQNNL
ncbi:MAG: glycerol acyltransferase [Bacteroidales bacterium]|nr:glycerol acyltransferase [Bacteroidales bacterium]